MRFQVARAASHTGQILQELVNAELQQERIQPPADALVCYGAGLDGNRPHTLNAACSRFNKMSQGQRLWESGRGVWGLEILDHQQALRWLEQHPGHAMLARKAMHTKGKDIMPVLEPWHVEARVRAGASFFTPYHPSNREFRTWVYRKRILGTYEKQLMRPELCRKIGRNYDNGFDFSFRERENLPAAMIEAAKGAVAALDLDFGAVDMIETPAGAYIVLEVNSAPGVQNERRRVVQALAHRIARWAANGCPSRNGAD